MMASQVVREVKRLRNKGWPMVEALRAAKVKEQFTRLEEQGLVRISIKCDDEPYDVGDCEDEKYKKAVLNRANNEGVVGIVTEFQDGGFWEVADSCWGFIGDDWKDSGYDTDLMASAVEQFTEASVETFKGHATQAMVA